MSKIGPCQCGGYEHPEVSLHELDCATLRTLTPLSNYMSESEVATLHRACPHFPFKLIVLMGHATGMYRPRPEPWAPCGIEVLLELAGARKAGRIHALPYDWAMLTTTICDPRRTDGLPERLNLWAATLSQSQEARGDMVARHDQLRQELELVLMEYADAALTTPVLARVSSWVRKNKALLAQWG